MIPQRSYLDPRLDPKPWKPTVIVSELTNAGSVGEVLKEMADTSLVCGLCGEAGHDCVTVCERADRFSEDERIRRFVTGYTDTMAGALTMLFESLDQMKAAASLSGAMDAHRSIRTLLFGGGIRMFTRGALCGAEAFARERGRRELASIISADSRETVNVGELGSHATAWVEDELGSGVKRGEEGKGDGRYQGETAGATGGLGSAGPGSPESGRTGEIDAEGAGDGSEG